MHLKFFVTHAALDGPLMKFVDHVLQKHSLLLSCYFLCARETFWFDRLQRRWIRCSKLLRKNFSFCDTRLMTSFMDASKPLRIVFAVHSIELNSFSFSWSGPWFANFKFFLLLLSKHAFFVHNCVVDWYDMLMNFCKRGIEIAREVFSFVVIGNIVYHYFLY